MLTATRKQWTKERVVEPKNKKRKKRGGKNKKGQRRKNGAQLEPATKEVKANMCGWLKWLGFQKVAWFGPKKVVACRNKSGFSEERVIQILEHFARNKSKITNKKTPKNRWETTRGNSRVFSPHSVAATIAAIVATIWHHQKMQRNGFTITTSLSNALPHCDQPTIPSYWQLW